jgi:DnaJ homolog subfamily B member 12
MHFDSPVPPRYIFERTIPNLKVKYYVNPQDVAQYSEAKLRQLDRSAEVNFVRQLNIRCENEKAHQRQLVEDAQGWFFQDADKMDVARNFDLTSCKRLRKLGL